MKSKYPPPKYLRLSPAAQRILDALAEELGDIGDRAAVEVLARFLQGLKESSGLSYTEILLRTDLPETPGFPRFDGRRKERAGTGAALS